MAQVGAARRLLGVRNRRGKGKSKRASVYKNGLDKPFLACFRVSQPGDYTPLKRGVNARIMKVGRTLFRVATIDHCTKPVAWYA